MSHRVVEVLLDNAVHPVVERRAKQQTLPALRSTVENTGYHREEAHVGHVIGLVEHRDFDTVERQHTLPYEVIEAAGRGDNNIYTCLKRCFLSTLRNASKNSSDGDPHGVCEHFYCLSNLGDEFASRCEHNGARPIRATLTGSIIGEVCDEGNSKRNGLARAGTATSEDIATREGVSERVSLNRERGILSVSSERISDGCGHTQIKKRRNSLCCGVGHRDLSKSWRAPRNACGRALLPESRFDSVSTYRRQSTGFLLDAQSCVQNSASMWRVRVQCRPCRIGSGTRAAFLSRLPEQWESGVGVECGVWKEHRMFVQQQEDGSERIVLSASDLTAASHCEFAFLRRVDQKLGRIVDVPTTDDPMLTRAAELGDAHELRTLAGYRAQYGTAGPAAPGTAREFHGVVEIARPMSLSPAALRERQHDTLSALAEGADVVFQATFFEPEYAGTPHGFVGFADFLQRLPDGRYEVQDTKLARRARVTALLQLAAYAEQLERLGVPVADEAVLLLGDGAQSRHRLADIAPVYRTRRLRLIELIDRSIAMRGADGTRAGAEPISWNDPDVAWCGTCEVCLPEISRTRDPLLIAGIRRAHRDALWAAGVHTIEAVAELSKETHIDGCSRAVLDRLSTQAALQTRVRVDEAPPYSVTRPELLATLPEPHPGDLFFDFEGDPMYREPGSGANARWGLDYLFGMVDAHDRYTALWAHSMTEERDALLDFLALVRTQRSRFPGMHIYHYAPYERTHLLSIAARHGVGEAEVDALLRDDVLVDLYPIVRRALTIGVSSYSIKQLEPLYMGTQTRDHEGVTTGAESVTAYAEAAALLGTRGTDLAAAKARDRGQHQLQLIAEYNRDDCVSTRKLRDWLLQQANNHGIVPGQHTVVPKPVDLEPSQSVERLLRAATSAPTEDLERAAALAASAVGYHEREQKSFWWAHFARLTDPVDTWADTRDVVIVDPGTSRVDEDWWRPPRAQKDRRTLTLRGSVAPGSTLRPGEVFVIYEDRLSGLRRAQQAQLLEVTGEALTVQERRGDVDTGGRFPLAVVPGPPPRPGTQVTAIEEWGCALADAIERGEDPRDPVTDLIRRLPPRGAVGDPPPLTRMEGNDAIADACAVVRALDRSYLAVQGPPGTGKTYLAAHVLHRLAHTYGWHIGVVAQSHRVVEHVLERVVAAGLPGEQVGKAPQSGTAADPQAPFTAIGRQGHQTFLEGHRNAGRGCVVGGTAWDFSHAGRFRRRELDLLVVEEAGQFALAPTAAASVAAKRLLLLGDPQQLPQVTQGTHPEPVDTSALAWLLGDQQTLPSEQGMFLAETRRMRPELTAIVSELAYESRLQAHPSTRHRTVAGAGPAGLTWHPVDHAGRSTVSPEEASVVVTLVQHMLRGELQQAGAPQRALTVDDLIVVAAYNAQVECVDDALSEAGITGVRVGTVDRFQGQEAVMAIVTLAASSPEDVPRGLEFLLMRNRLNVAISRAQWGAHLVSSRQLGTGLPATPEGLAALSGYIRLLEHGC